MQDTRKSGWVNEMAPGPVHNNCDTILTHTHTLDCTTLPLMWKQRIPSKRTSFKKKIRLWCSGKWPFGGKVAHSHTLTHTGTNRKWLVTEMDAFLSDWRAGGGRTSARLQTCLIWQRILYNNFFDFTTYCLPIHFYTLKCVLFATSQFLTFTTREAAVCPRYFFYVF